MYVIGNFIYGINLGEGSALPERFKEEVAVICDEDRHVEYHYSGSGDQPMFLGVDMVEIDEANSMNWAEIVKLKDELKAAMSANSQQAQEFQTKIQDFLTDTDVSDDLKNWVKAQTPEVFLVWSTS